jgi:hypothetical protein
MRHLSIAMLITTLTFGTAIAQSPSASSDPDNPAANAANSSGAPPDTQKQPQPQGPTGPTNTTSGGAPASSPQGDTPSGMQPAPHDPEKGVSKK